MTELECTRLKKMANDITSFNDHQLIDALYWMALGDGTITKPERGECLMRISHVLDNQDYIYWKAAILGGMLKCSIKPMETAASMLRITTQHHPVFTTLYNRIYGAIGRKSIDPHALKVLGPLGLAILYQDDGSYHYSSDAGHNILIHKMCFSKFELEAFAKTVVDKFGIIFRINQCKGNGLGYRIRLRAKDRTKFFDLIEPYIVPSMLHKVGRGSTTKSSDDMI